MGKSGPVAPATDTFSTRVHLSLNPLLHTTDLTHSHQCHPIYRTSVSLLYGRATYVRLKASSRLLSLNICTTCRCYCVAPHMDSEYLWGQCHWVLWFRWGIGLLNSSQLFQRHLPTPFQLSFLTGTNRTEGAGWSPQLQVGLFFALFLLTNSSLHLTHPIGGQLSAGMHRRTL